MSLAAIPSMQALYEQLSPRRIFVFSSHDLEMDLSSSLAIFAISESHHADPSWRFVFQSPWGSFMGLI